MNAIRWSMIKLDRGWALWPSEVGVFKKQPWLPGRLACWQKLISIGWKVPKGGPSGETAIPGLSQEVPRHNG